MVFEVAFTGHINTQVFHNFFIVLSKLAWSVPIVQPNHVLLRIMSFPYRFVCVNVKRSLNRKQDPLYGDCVSSAPEKNPDGYWLDCKRTSGNQENNAALFDHCNITNMQVWLNHSRCLSVDMAAYFAKEQYAGVNKSFYDFASRYYGIDNLLAGSGVCPATFKSLYPIHVFDVSKQSERLTEGVVDLTVRMEFSTNVPANTQAYALVISDRMLKFKSDGLKMSYSRRDSQLSGALYERSTGENKTKRYIYTRIRQQR